MAGTEAPGTFVVSLDFELAWGMRRGAAGGYAPNLHGSRIVIPRLLELFQEHGIAATWATVGFLFAESREELRSFSPPTDARPAYTDPGLFPFDDAIGESESHDPLHYGSRLIERIRATPRQEIASHTFSHYYCLEAGQTAEAFRADLIAAKAIARRRGIEISSIVFPRNQHNATYDGILLEHGITAYRGTTRAWMWRFSSAEESASPSRRAARLVDSYVSLSGHGTYPWDQVLQPSGLADVRASAFLRPASPRTQSQDALRLRRIRRSLRAAARRGQIYHLWWHPHNFGLHIDENLAMLRAILEEFSRLQGELGMVSMAMRDVDRAARDATSLSRMSASTRSPIF
jgi:peptidoglycan/xylan/chitin deacetylase (PgdA/CDA1 family)